MIQDGQKQKQVRTGYLRSHPTHTYLSIPTEQPHLQASKQYNIAVL
jgi:hypothetical protein